MQYGYGNRHGHSAEMLRFPATTSTRSLCHQHRIRLADRKGCMVCASDVKIKVTRVIRGKCVNLSHLLRHVHPTFQVFTTHNHSDSTASSEGFDGAKMGPRQVISFGYRGRTNHTEVWYLWHLILPKMAPSDTKIWG